MLNKSLAFGLLAAGLMVTPAFAGQQNNSQRIEQTGVARNGSTVVNDAKQSARNENTSVNIRNRYGCYTKRTAYVAQNNDQYIGQVGDAKNGSTVANVGRQRANNSNSNVKICN